ncbi:TNNT3 [Branchiostoma lanceolatum]|uniref:TNNT3 protein n=1 Tax=Branchiostoma lanceolatum TaxID=7740 RepID=A0A8J9ZM75_BRALA|nr:TNNT3 [Branchiostoma lanceolatum]
MPPPLRQAPAEVEEEAAMSDYEEEAVEEEVEEEVAEVAPEPEAPKPKPPPPAAPKIPTGEKVDLGAIAAKRKDKDQLELESLIDKWFEKRTKEDAELEEMRQLREQRKAEMAEKEELRKQQEKERIEAEKQKLKTQREQEEQRRRMLDDRKKRLGNTNQHLGGYLRTRRMREQKEAEEKRRRELDERKKRLGNVNMHMGGYLRTLEKKGPSKRDMAAEKKRKTVELRVGKFSSDAVSESYADELHEKLQHSEEALYDIKDKVKVQNQDVERLRTTVNESMGKFSKPGAVSRGKVSGGKWGAKK